VSLGVEVSRDRCGIIGRGWRWDASRPDGRSAVSLLGLLSAERGPGHIARPGIEYAPRSMIGPEHASFPVSETLCGVAYRTSNLVSEALCGVQYIEVRGGVVMFEAGALEGNFLGVIFTDENDSEQVGFTNPPEHPQHLYTAPGHLWLGCD
jgi:hypothetical protein